MNRARVDSFQRLDGWRRRRASPVTAETGSKRASRWAPLMSINRSGGVAPLETSIGARMKRRCDVGGHGAISQQTCASATSGEIFAAVVDAHAFGESAAVHTRGTDFMIDQPQSPIAFREGAPLVPHAGRQSWRKPPNSINCSRAIGRRLRECDGTGGITRLHRRRVANVDDLHSFLPKIPYGESQQRSRKDRRKSEVAGH